MGGLGWERMGGRGGLDEAGFGLDDDVGNEELEMR